MTLTLKNKITKLIHIGLYLSPEGRMRYLLLREDDPCSFHWYERQPNSEEAPTHVSGPNIEEALRLAHNQWSGNSFRTIICGFRYTLPERDEHGSNALFHQMVTSYRTMQGVYFDDEVGHNCYIERASQEALSLWKTFEKEDRLGF